MLAAALLLLAAATPVTITGVASVIDGDTLDIHGERIRLWGIDAPESSQPCQRAGETWRCGQQAALALADWLDGVPVHCVARNKDYYGRTVAVCTRSGVQVNSWLVIQGWALDYPRYSKGEYKAEQVAAEQAQRGVWQGTFTKPWEYRRRK